jgi:hypothetical protein
MYIYVCIKLIIFCCANNKVVKFQDTRTNVNIEFMLKVFYVI